jgi:hypothetical protein
MTEPRIELWSDESDSEFAISLTPLNGRGSSPTFVIKTNDKASYSKKIDESVFMDGYTYNWKHTLAQWVQFHFGNQFVVNIPDSTIEHEYVNVKRPEPKRTRFRPHYLKLAKPSKIHTKPKPRSGISQGVLKCHYCNLKYCLEEERKQHEKFWHSNKLE